MDSTNPQPNVTREPQESALDPPSHVPLGTDVPLPPQVPSDIPVMDPAQSGTQLLSEKEESLLLQRSRLQSIPDPPKWARLHFVDLVECTRHRID